MRLADLADKLAQHEDVQVAKAKPVGDPAWEKAKAHIDTLPSSIELILRTNKEKIRKSESANYTRLSIPLPAVFGFESEFLCYEPTARGDKADKELQSWYVLFNPRGNVVYKRDIVTTSASRKAPF